MTARLVSRAICDICSTSVDTAPGASLEGSFTTIKNVAVTPDDWAVMEFDGESLDLCPECTKKMHKYLRSIQGIENREVKR